MALADLSSGKLPGESIASSLDEVNVAPGLRRVASFASSDSLLALAAIEMKAAGVTDPRPDPADVAGDFERLADEYPAVPLIQYRCGSYLLTRIQLAIRDFQRLKAEPDASAFCSATAALALQARAYFARAAELDQENSVYYYDTAYSYLAQGDAAAAEAWFARGAQARRFETGDDVVLSACQRLVSAAGAPGLEQKLADYHVSRYAPSFLGARMETLAAQMLTSASALGPESPAYSDRMMALEDLGDKLFQSADVLRQSQASLVTAGLVWRQAARDAARRDDDHLAAEAQKRLAEASYRYLLIGWQRASEGLLPQQAVVELDTPVDLRLDFSRAMQRIASALLVVTLALLAVAALAGVASVKWAKIRQGALAAVTLCAFTFLAYAGCFYSLASERSRTSDGLEKRLAVIKSAPEYLRQNGQPSSRADYDLEIAKSMLPSYDYTFQAARVLAYVGTRDCFDTLIAALDDPKVPSPGEVAVALRDATGRDFGYRVENSRSANYEAVRAWREWWKDNRDSFPETVSATPGAPAN
jgi:hypothetical protein